MAVAIVLAIAWHVTAAQDVLPPPPENPPWVEPVPVPVTTSVLVDGADSGPADFSSVGQLASQWTGDGQLIVEGWIAHNGAERLAAERTHAWLQGSQVVIAYRYAEKSFPREPWCLCRGFSRVRFVLKGLASRPAEVEIHEGRLEFRRLLPKGA